MARGLGTLVVDLILKAGGFESDMGRASKTAQKRMREIEKSVKDAGKVIGTALVAGAAASTIALKSSIDAADELSKASQKIGIPIEALSGLKYAAELADVAFDQLQSGVGKLIKFQAAAAEGGKEQTRVFEAFGISIKDLDGNLRATNDVFADFADVFKALPDGPEKTALALRVFGKAGAELIPLLNEGRDGIKEFLEEARELGVVIDSSTGRQAEAFNDNLSRLKIAVGGLATQVATDLLPDLVSLTDEFVDSIKTGNGVSQTAKDIANGLRVLGSIALAATDLLQGLARSLIVVYQAGKLINPTTLAQAIVSGEIGETLDVAKMAGSDSLDEYKQMLSRFDQSQKISIGYRPNNVSGQLSRSKNRFNEKSVIDQSTLDAAKKLYTPEEADKAKKEIDKLGSAYKNLEDNLRSQIALHGEVTETAKVRYELENGELANLNDSQKQNLLGLAAQIDAQKEAEKIAEEGKALAESLISPLEKLNQERKKAQELLDAGAISQDTYNRAIAAAIEPGQQLLRDLEFEADLLKLTNAERAAAIQMRGLDAESIRMYGDEIVAANQKIEEGFKLTRAMDEFRYSFEDAFASILDGSKSIKDAFRDLADSILSQIARIIAQKWVEKLFGGFGTTGGGLFGDIIGSLFTNADGNVFRNGAVTAFADGGVVGGPSFFPMNGGLGLMGEAGPEAIMPLKRGKDGKLGVAGGGQSLVINFSTTTPMSRQTQDQLASVIYSANKRATRTV